MATNENDPQNQDKASKKPRENSAASADDSATQLDLDLEPKTEAVSGTGAPRSYATSDADLATGGLDGGNESFAVEDERNASADADGGPEKIELNFYGSDILRLRIPKTFEFAETVIDEWKNDGRFEALPLPSPLAQMVAQVGLRKAKDLEKKLEDKGVFQMAKIGIDYAKSKIQR